ncbi:peptidyl-tRNA hydrolase 2, mitochondrial isoform X2 [Diaphorina citri]|uniref:peptidyl-tRNA hydrolase n=1 Tax=Diaphorina citri TaxID=121845 RepID=A0A1S4ES37_DIACI|nr:peptidyl-tRNA hydrolase 2, mitochondrial isoform X2 [Diaphorina citri]
MSFLSNIEPSHLILGFAAGVLVTLACQNKVAYARSRFNSGGNSANHAVSGRDYVKMVMVVRNDLGMGKGKIAAQCAHAAVGCVEKAYKKDSPFLNNWMRQGQPKIVVKCDKPGEEALQELAMKAKKMGVTNVIIHDAGHTQVASGTATVLGLGPATNNQLDAISGHLKLL